MSAEAKIIYFPNTGELMTPWQGFYSTSQVSRLARIPVRTLYDWRAQGIISPSVQLISQGLVADYGYSYADLTIIKLMRALRDDRLDLKSVGIALHHLYERLGHPSTGWHDAHVYIVGNRVHAEQQDQWETTTATQFGQKVETRLFGDLFPILRKQEEHGDILVPPEFSKYVEINPLVMGGQPVVRDTRVPTSILGTLAEKGRTLDDLARLYAPLPRQAIKVAIDYERFLSQPIEAKPKAAASTS